MRATISNGWNPIDVAAGASHVWVVDSERELHRLDPRTNRVTGHKRVPGRIWGGVAAGRAGVWLVTVPGRGPVTGPAGPRILWRVHSQTLGLSRVMRLTCDARLWVAESVWALGACNGFVFRPRGRPIDVARSGSDLALEAGSVWKPVRSGSPKG
ncbi:MAG: hypothetical protein H0V79_12995 [Actinobacteria bacterium]|nr:hypothetical protein [Actinomycetota bacterium]